MVIKHLMVMRANDRMCHPVIPYEKLEEVAGSEKLEEHIPATILINILLHLLIIAPDPSLKTQYIVPSMLPHSLPTAKTGIKVDDNVIPSVADNTFVEVELLLSIKSFKFRIPTTLHSLVLCTQDVQCTMKMNECSKTYAQFSRIKNGMATFQLTFFKEGISLSLKTDESTERCVYAKNAVRYALRRACMLVGYGAPVVTNYILFALFEAQLHNSRWWLFN